MFNLDGSLAELKGFELKRRGELKIIKIFQEQVFARFLEGTDLESCYAAVAVIAEFWLQVLSTEGEEVDDEELLELISENRTMSRTVADYGAQKSTSLTTARRLADFLGADMIKHKGLQCKMVIARKPIGAPVTERAIPVAIFSAEHAVKRRFLRRWTGDQSLDDCDIREIIDWGYYEERLGSSIRKIITIPAALQRVDNPLKESLPHPEWLLRAIRQETDPHKQKKITSMFGAAPAGGGGGGLVDLEDIARPPSAARPVVRSQCPRRSSGPAGGRRRGRTRPARGKRT